MRSRNSSIKRRLALEGAMTIYEAAAHKRALLQALERAAELDIDLSRVTEMDTAGVQILALVKREASKQGKTVRLAVHSEASRGAIGGYNLGAFFGDPVVIHGP